MPLCDGEGVGFPYVKEAEVGLYVTVDRVFGAETEVEVNDAESAWEVGEVGKEFLADDVYAGEGIVVAVCGVEVGEGAFDLVCGGVGPADELHVVVEEEVSLCGALADEECCAGALGCAEEGGQVSVAEYVDVVYDYSVLCADEV